MSTSYAERMLKPTLTENDVDPLIVREFFSYQLYDDAKNFQEVESYCKFLKFFLFIVLVIRWFVIGLQKKIGIRE